MGHASDCAVHNGPALPVGPCNCGEADLPAGYRWATEEECAEIAATGRTTMLDEHIVVPRTVDSTGKPYTQDEADIAVRIVIEEPLRRCECCKELIAKDPDGKTWRHPHSGDIYCGTGDGQVAIPELP